MDEVIYVLGQGIAREHVWRNAHPRNKRANTSLTLFDYVDEKQRTWTRWAGEHPPSTAADSETDVASVLDLYEHVKDAEPRSVVELHFFTHATEGGPVLYNTFDFSLDPTVRDSNDKDPRIKDFTVNGVLAGSDGVRFATAFTGTALIKLWGCTHLEQYRQMIKRDFYQTKKKEKRTSVKEIYKGLIRDGTYQYALHRATSRPVFAAPLGWGTNPYLPFGIHGKDAEKTKAKYVGRFPPKRGDQWWRVSQWFRPDGGHAFYARELGASFDVLDYVAYDERIVRSDEPEAE